MVKVLYQCREVLLVQQDGAYVVCTDDTGQASPTFNNPLEAWTCFIDVLDCRVRRRIGDMLDKEGKNRYSGAKM